MAPKSISAGIKTGIPPITDSIFTVIIYNIAARIMCNTLIFHQNAENLLTELDNFAIMYVVDRYSMKNAVHP